MSRDNLFVETFPARPRQPPINVDGGTSLEGRTPSPIDNREKTVNVPPVRYRKPHRARRPSTCPGTALERVPVLPLRRRPAVVGLRRLSWTGWERLYGHVIFKPSDPTDAERLIL